jgi:hypothetical protein
VIQAALITGRNRLGVVVASIVAVSLAGCGAAATPGCVSVPRSIPNRVLADPDARLTVHLGDVVYAVLVEADEYTDHPGFPWQTPRSSQGRVLTAVRLCKETGASSLPVEVFGFRAVGKGAAALSAALTADWRRAGKRPGTYRALVKVLR